MTPAVMAALEARTALAGRHMRGEMREQPDVLGSLARHVAHFAQQTGVLSAQAGGFDEVVFLASACAENAALLGRYAVQARCGIPARVLTSAEPTDPASAAEDAAQRRRLAVVLSPSGSEPGVISLAARYAESGAALVVVTNEARSPLARSAALCVDLAAGLELAASATKTMTSLMLAVLAIVEGLPDSSGTSVISTASAGSVVIAGSDGGTGVSGVSGVSGTSAASGSSGGSAGAGAIAATATATATATDTATATVAAAGASSTAPAASAAGCHAADRVCGTGLGDPVGAKALARLVADLLADPAPAVAAAARLVTARRIAVVGSDHHFPAALETARMLREAAGLMVEGFSADGFRTGPVGGFDAETSAVLLAGDAHAAVRDLRGALIERGVPVVSIGSAVGDLGAAYAGHALADLAFSDLDDPGLAGTSPKGAGPKRREPKRRALKGGELKGGELKGGALNGGDLEQADFAIPDLAFPALGTMAECILATVRGQQLALAAAAALGVDPDRRVAA
jgi:glucosamine--fructose-6-phosphate aminotransferase (isomerizing)